MHRAQFSVKDKKHIDKMNRVILEFGLPIDVWAIGKEGPSEIQ